MSINKSYKSNEEKQFLLQIGIELGNARRKRHLTQNKVAAIVGCSLSHINDIENGNANTTAFELVTLCKLYKVSITTVTKSSTLQLSGLELLPKDEQKLIKTMYQKLLYSHRNETE